MKPLLLFATEKHIFGQYTYVSESVAVDLR